MIILKLNVFGLPQTLADLVDTAGLRLNLTVKLFRVGRCELDIKERITASYCAHRAVRIVRSSRV